MEYTFNSDYYDRDRQEDFDEEVETCKECDSTDIVRHGLCSECLNENI